MAKKLLYLAAVGLLVLAVGQGVVRADTGPEHRIEQERPIQLGTSGGSIGDSSTIYCCGGTLGALVENGNIQYILSNNHVLARTNTASAGEAAIHPGLIDQSPVCYEDVDDTVAHLSDFIKIRFKKGRVVPLNKVDAAIAQVVAGAVEPNGVILDIGQASSNTVSAFLGQEVQKSGRTSGHTVGTVAAIAVTVDVGYSKDCGGATNQVARFVEQILITPGAFSSGGDSGSLIVEANEVDPADGLPRAVGLLFAGSSTYTVANPIDAVLNAFGVTMPGGAPPEPGPTGSITGTVTNSTDGSIIEGAAVTVDGGEPVLTAPDGIYIIADVAIGDHSVKASADGLKTQTKTATVNEDAETTVDFALKPQKGKGKPSSRAAINRAVRVKKRHEQNIFQIDGVVGAGVGLSETGQPIIEIYLKKDLAEARSRIPAALDNVPVRLVVTGPFEAF